MRGARLLRDHLHASEHVYCFVLQLERPLALGEQAMLEIALEGDGAYTPHPETGAFVVRPIRNLVLWTRFELDAVPDWMEEVEKTGPDELTATRPIRPQASIIQTRRDFGPGALGLRWGYDDR